MATRTKKAKKEPKPLPPMRLFFGDELYHTCDYLGNSEAEETYHDSSITDRLEKNLTRRLTEAAKTIVAENPETGLLKL